MIINILFILTLYFVLYLSYRIYKNEDIPKYKFRKKVLFYIVFAATILFWLPIIMYLLQ